MRRALPQQWKLLEKQPMPYVVFYLVVPTSKSVEGIFIYFTCQKVEIPVAFLPVNLLNLPKLCALKAKASSIPALGQVLPASWRMTLPIYPALVRHMLGTGPGVVLSSAREDVDKVEWVQWRAIKMVGTGLFCLKKRKTWGDLPYVCKYLIEKEVKQKEPVQVLHGCSQQEDKTHWVQTETQGFLPEHRKTPGHCHCTGRVWSLFPSLEILQAGRAGPWETHCSLSRGSLWWQSLEVPAILCESAIPVCLSLGV